MNASEEIQNIQFSTDGKHIDISTTEGFRIMSSEPSEKLQNEKTRELGNIQQCQNINNIVAYVRGGEECPRRELYIYDDYHEREGSKIVFKSKINTLKLSTNCILVILEKKAYLFDLNNQDQFYKEPKCIKKFETIDNEAGLGCLYSHNKRNVVILPGQSEKSIQIYDSQTGDDVLEYEVGEVPSILAGNIHGDIFAFAGQDGTQIYVHKIEDGSLYRTYSRGSKKMEVNQIAFDKFCFRMAVASKGDTVHVYCLPKELALNGKTPEEVKLSLISLEGASNDKSTPESLIESRVNPTGFFSYFSSGAETSYLKVYISGSEKSLAIIDQKLMILTQEGKLYSTDIQNQGYLYPNSEEVTETDLFNEEE